MPEPVRTGQRYMPGLDGLRAFAVLAVIAFHEQLGWAPGGLLGVGVFFTLSGYLITDLLLGQWSARGRLQLADFWARRARRLLPALFVMLAVVTAWVTLADRARLGSLRGAVAAAATYSSNWYLIIQNQSYFARFAPPAPLDHLWSLAVEEQFYLAWPWLLLLGLLCLRAGRGVRSGQGVRAVRGMPGRWSGPVGWLALPTLALATASAVAMLALYHPGLDPTRVYEGTDTRACGLLIGAALAMIWPSRRAAPSARAVRVLVDVAGAAGLAGILVMIWRTGQYSPFIYRGGLIVLSLATAGVLAAAACPGSWTGRALGWAPLRWLGIRSYGIYLWHYPVIVLTSPANSTENLARAALQTAATIAIAALSWRYVEEPIRHGALGRLWASVRSPSPASPRTQQTQRTQSTQGAQRAPLTRTARAAGLAAATGTAGVLVVACAGLSGAVPATGNASTASLAAGSTLPSPPGSAGHPSADSSPAASTSQKHSTTRNLSTSQSPSGTQPGAPGLRTSCRAVVHIGDSTSEGMISPSYLPNPAQRLAAQYEDVGVQTVRTDIVGARSVVETLPGTVNGYDAARTIVSGGYRGCWVIALGTNDTADVAIGSGVSDMARIQQMMSAAHGQPVMWVDVISLLSSGPYAEINMQQWNATLRHVCSRYPNMRVFDWSSLAQSEPGWFITDGIHYTSAGYAIRGRQIAQALARAFPEKGHSQGCMVS
jgi:peptidoglycan/LPS O-acetylase OafA/YrhL/lysophospholipase L1-like esterase